MCEIDVNLYFFFLKSAMFAKSGELLTMRLRKMAFESMLKQVSILTFKTKVSLSLLIFSGSASLILQTVYIL